MKRAIVIIYEGDELSSVDTANMISSIQGSIANHSYPSVTVYDGQGISDLILKGTSITNDVIPVTEATKECDAALVVLGGKFENFIKEFHRGNKEILRNMLIKALIEDKISGTVSEITKSAGILAKPDSIYSTSVAERWNMSQGVIDLIRLTYKNLNNVAHIS